MATATPTPTPNPDAMKFNLDVTLGEMFNVTSATEAEQPFAKAVFAAPRSREPVRRQRLRHGHAFVGRGMGADHRGSARGSGRLPLSYHSISWSMPRPSSNRRSRRYAWNGGSWSNGLRGGSTTRSRKSYDRL